MIATRLPFQFHEIHTCSNHHAPFLHVVLHVWGEVYIEGETIWEGNSPGGKDSIYSIWIFLLRRLGIEANIWRHKDLMQSVHLGGKRSDTDWVAGATEAGESDFRDEKLVQESKKGESSTDTCFIRRLWDKAEHSGEDMLVLRTLSPQSCGHCIFHFRKDDGFSLLSHTRKTLKYDRA